MWQENEIDNKTQSISDFEEAEMRLIHTEFLLELVKIENEIMRVQIEANLAFGLLDEYESKLEIEGDFFIRTLRKLGNKIINDFIDNKERGDKEDNKLDSKALKPIIKQFNNLVWERVLWLLREIHSIKDIKDKISFLDRIYQNHEIKIGTFYYREKNIKQQQTEIEAALSKLDKNRPLNKLNINHDLVKAHDVDSSLTTLEKLPHFFQLKESKVYNLKAHAYDQKTIDEPSDLAHNIGKLGQ